MSSSPDSDRTSRAETLVNFADTASRSASPTDRSQEGTTQQQHTVTGSDTAAEAPYPAETPSSSHLAGSSRTSTRPTTDSLGLFSWAASAAEPAWITTPTLLTMEPGTVKPPPRTWSMTTNHGAGEECTRKHVDDPSPSPRIRPNPANRAGYDLNTNRAREMDALSLAMSASLRLTARMREQKYNSGWKVSGGDDGALREEEADTGTRARVAKQQMEKAKVDELKEKLGMVAKMSMDQILAYEVLQKSLDQQMEACDDILKSMEGSVEGEGDGGGAGRLGNALTLLRNRALDDDVDGAGCAAPSLATLYGELKSKMSAARQRDEKILSLAAEVLGIAHAGSRS